jgi:hypothetical protein
MAWNVSASPTNYSPGVWADGDSLQAGSGAAAAPVNYNPGEWAGSEGVGSGLLTGFAATAHPLYDWFLGEALIYWADSTPPHLENRDPAPSQIGVTKNKVIALDIVDESGIDLSTVVIKVEGVDAYVGATDSFVSPYNAPGSTRSDLPLGHHFNIQKTSNWARLDTISVRVIARDVLGNLLDTTYTFDIQDYWMPIIDDTFDDEVLPSFLPGGNGTWTEEAEGGGVLWYHVPMGTDTDWWPSVGGSPQYRHCHAAYYDLGSVSAFTRVVIECQLHDWNPLDTSYNNWIFGLWAADNNMVWIYGTDRSNVRAYKVYSSSQTYLGYLPWPSGSPIGSRVRHVWDRVRGVFFFEVWDAANNQWLEIANTPAAITPTRVVLGGKNWGSNFPAYTISWDWIYGYGELDERTGITYDYTSPGAEPTLNAVEPSVGGYTDRGSGTNFGFQFPATAQDQLARHFFPTSGRQHGWADEGGVAAHSRARLPQQVENPVPYSHIWLDGTPAADPAAGGTIRRAGNLDGVGAWGDVDRDVAKLTEVALVNFRRDTYDIDGHVHVNGEYFSGHSFFYDTTGEDWADPATSLLTGYARSGYYYINGVNQGSLAPWASEASGAHRSARPDFPVRSLIMINRNELTIYDLDSFPSQFRVWMRFLLSGTTTYNLVGGETDTLRGVSMKDGILCVVSREAAGPGGLCIVNFKANDQNFVHLIRSDDHWKGTTGRNITHRNTTGNYTTSGISPEFRLGATGNYRVSQYAVKAGEAPDGEKGQMIAVGGLGAPPDVFRYYNNAPQLRTVPEGPDVGGTGTFASCVCFDDYGLFYFTDREGTVFRNLRDYFQGVILADKSNPRSAWATIDYTIYDLKHLRDQIYVAGALPGSEQFGGVYRIERKSMRSWLAYTTVGKGGGGRLNAPPAGEILAGQDPRVVYLQGINVALSSYLIVASWTGSAITLIRLYDDHVVSSHEYGGAEEPLADPKSLEGFVMSR